MHPTVVLAFVMLGVVALVPVTYLAVAPDPVPVYLGPAQQQAAVATPNHDPHRVPLGGPAKAEPVEARTAEILPAESLTMDALVAEALTAESDATPNLDPRPPAAMSSFALGSVALRAEPEPGTPSAPALIFTDTMLYAKESARVRAAPSMTADVLAQLDANAKLRASARSADGIWWRVPLGDGRIGYVHRAAVTSSLIAPAKPAAASAPVVAAAPAQQPIPTRRNQGFLGYVDQTVNWFVDTASKGSPPTVMRPER